MCPHGVIEVRRFISCRTPRILDVGCGNHSPKNTKRYLPRCEYHGVDIRRMNRDAEDDRCMDRFFDVDLNFPAQLAVIPDGSYDVVICSHVLEHLDKPYVVAGKLAEKVNVGGMLFFEVPSVRSLRLPRAADGWLGVRGCLNFFDDDTHKTLVDIDDVAEVVVLKGLTVRRVGPRRLWRRVFLLPLYVAACVAVKGFVPASVLWDVMGFARILVAVRETAV